MEFEEPPTVIVGRVGRRLTNALTLSLVDRPGEPAAVARQGGDSGWGGKLAIMLGLRNHGPGRHLLQTREGDRLVTVSGYNGPTFIERDGSRLATVECAATTTVSDPGGTVLLTVEPDPARASTVDVDRHIVRGPDGRPVAHIDVILARSGWELTPNEVIGFGLGLATEGLGALLSDGTPSNGSLPIHILGTRLLLPAGPLPRATRDLLLALCVDLTLGGRSYVATA
jgi:hypothetical protein